ncbi:histidine kinase [uncultured Fibrella sp.]|uniref:histidine kinase n=1 Tax=uncultured Fibrella sp. TaxID=1284596 RepID=UPI0035CABDEE
MRGTFLLWFSACYWMATSVVAQPIALCRVKTEQGPYLRFDQFAVNDDAFKRADTQRLALNDSQGYLWFINNVSDHNELIRYDGTYAKSFGAADWIDIKENDRHEIWAFNKKGLCRYDPHTEQFRTYLNPLVVGSQLGRWVTGRGDENWFYWPDSLLGTRPFVPIVAYNTRTNRARLITPARLVNGYSGRTEKDKLRLFAPYSVDSMGRVWGSVNTRTDFTVGYYEPRTNVLVWYPVRGFLAPQFDKSTAPGQKFDALNVIHADGPYVWVGGWNRMGLLRLDTRTGHWKQYYFGDLAHNRVADLTRRNSHQFWLTTDDVPAIFDTASETLYPYPHQPDNPFSLDAHSRGATPGRLGTVWFDVDRAGATSSGFSVLHEARQPFRTKSDTLLRYQGIFRALYKKSADLYVAYNTDRVNFARYNEVTHRLKSLFQLPLNGFVEQYLYAALPDTVNQTVWVVGQSAAGGIFQYNEKRGMTTPVRATIQGLPPGENQTANYDGIQCLAQDKAGNVWFPSFGAAGVYGGNLLKFDSRTKQFVGFRAGTHGLPKAQIRAIMIDVDGKIWLGYRGGGPLIRFDPATSQATTILPNGTDVIKLADDPARGVVWIAHHDAGLWQYVRRTKTSRRVLNESVLGVWLTKTGRLWLKTSSALVRYVPETGQQQRFGSDYDLHSFNWSPFTKTADDEFFFEKFRFRDRDIKPDTTKPVVVFSFLKVFDKELPLPKGLNSTKTLDLDYDQDFFTIGFSALSYFQSDRNQYMYRLVGFNKDWVRCGNKPLAVFSNVPPGTYPFQIKGSNNDGSWSDVKTLSIHIIPPFWQTGWFRFLAVSLLVTSVVLLYRFQVERRTLKARLEAEAAKRKQTEAELKEQEAAYKLRLSATEMAALRSQMNPHFIFNCLNSIQYFTAQNDAEKASEYLTKFSRLIRLVLENSKSERVTLQNELETLRLYLEMETMRFQQKVRYTIQVSETIDAEAIQIPPLLLQPFVENAIWHGLMHKEEGGLVRVLVEQPQADRLRIEIADDGVGRAKAAEYKSKSATRNKSFGMKLTADRIELINQLYQTHTRIQVEDLIDEQGRATGTSVIVLIPV